MYYVVAYDIADPRRLRRVARYMERRGVRVQKSVFVFQGTPEGLERMLDAMSPLLKIDADSVLTWRIGMNQDANGSGRGLRWNVFPASIIRQGNQNLFVEGKS